MNKIDKIIKEALRNSIDNVLNEETDMALAIVVSATVASAASFDWKTSATGKIYGAGTTTLLASGTAYIFDAATVSQQALVEAFMKDGSLMSGSLNSKAVSAGVIKATNDEAFSWAGGDALEALSGLYAPPLPVHGHAPVRGCQQPVRTAGL